MGSHFQIYAGPYLYCSTRTSPLTKEIKLCPHFQCRFHNEDNLMDSKNVFCPQCGRKAEAKTIEVPGLLRDDIDCCQLNEDTNEDLCQYNAQYADSGVQLFIPNVDHIRNFFCSETGEFPVGAALIERETQWLEKRFDTGIARAREIYGNDKVEVRWGILGAYR